MTPQERRILQRYGHSFLISDIFSTLGPLLLCYGIFAPLSVITITSLIKKPQKSFLSWTLIGVASYSFISLTMSISVYLWAMFMMLDTFKITSTIGLLASSRLVNKRLVKWNLVMFWLNLLPPVLNDGIIIWRAWTISGSKRWALYICNALWITSAATTLAVLIFDSSNPEFTAVAEGFDMAYKILNTASALLSFATNMLATGLIGYILWKNLRFLRTLGKHRHMFKTWHILVILLESGIVYGILQLVRAILPLIPTPLHVQDVTLVANCVFQSVYISVSGFYPILTLSIINGPFSTNNVQEAVIESRAISLEIPQSA